MNQIILTQEPGKPWIEKGTRVRARWFKPKELGTWSLTGFQMKLTGNFVEITGTVRHIRGDHPTEPKEVMFYVEPEGEVPAEVTRKRPFGCTCEGHDKLVEVNSNWVRQILGADGEVLFPKPKTEGPDIPAECSLRMSHYGRCKLGTYGCTEKHSGVGHDDAKEGS